LCLVGCDVLMLWTIVSLPLGAEEIMHRRELLIITLCCLFCALEWGCSSQAGRSKAEIESKLKHNLNLKEIHLTEGEKGNYDGTGTTADGTTLKIKVTQSEGELRWEYEDSEGRNGGGSEGARESRPPPD